MRRGSSLMPWFSALGSRLTLLLRQGPNTAGSEGGARAAPRAWSRHPVENLFADLKQFRGLATRYCKLVARFRAMICRAGWFLATKGAGRVWF